MHTHRVLCRYQNEIVLLNTWLSLITSTIPSKCFLSRSLKTLCKRGKYYYFLATDLETEIQRNSVICQDHQTRWAKTDKGAHDPLKHWFTLWFTLLFVVSLPSVCSWEKFPIQNNFARFTHSRGTKTSQICIDSQIVKLPSYSEYK